VCGIDAQQAGTLLSNQTPGDCLKRVCDGLGHITEEPDDADIPDDFNDCTADSCFSGQPQHDPVLVGSGCVGAGNAKVCNAAGLCVECVVGSECASLVCAPDNSCAAPRCDDQVQNQTETDIDCGGPCSPCAVGQGCAGGTDCASGKCNVASCGEYTLLISETRPRGPGGGSDDFVELYNPLAVAVTMTDELNIATRSDAAGSYTVRWQPSAGQTIVVPAHGHFLVVGSAYSGTVAKDADLSSGISDKASIVLERGGTVIDAVCIYCGAVNPFGAGYSCEGSPFVLTGCTSNNADRGLERKPGAAAGNAQDSGDSATDFQIIVPALPQDLASAPTP